MVNERAKLYLNALAAATRRKQRKFRSWLGMIVDFVAATRSADKNFKTIMFNSLGIRLTKVGAIYSAWLYFERESCAFLQK